MPSPPEIIETENQLDDLLTTPSEALVALARTLNDPLVILGAGGKMGPTLAVLAQRAIEQAGSKVRVIAASRFHNESARRWLHDRGVETQQVDVLDPRQLSQLPDATNVLYLVGMKFGTARDPVPTWATNTVAPVHVCERYSGARIVALSTGNVYPLSQIDGGGSVESDPLTPLGEYANAAVARERIFQHYSTLSGTPIAIMRLNYAHDLRYGVLTDLASKIWRGEEIDLAMGHFNAIWQGDANELILRALDLCSVPAAAFNLTSPEIYTVREVVQRLSQLLDKPPRMTGQESPTALLSNATRLSDALGRPRVELDQLLRWIAHWTRIGGETLNKPTHFESRDGSF